MMQHSVVVIPARYASQRLPGKPLIPLAGKPMIQWVYERALQIPGVRRVVVATDDDRIMQTVQSFKGEAFLTPADITNGSERVGYLAREIDAEIIVNLQGDEPLIPATSVGRAIQLLGEDERINIATLGYPLKSEEDWHNPAIVKVIVDSAMNAIYFSRAPIPFHREQDFQPLPLLFRHIGVYIYRKSFLLDFLGWQTGMLETREKLEQLRILEHGYKIKVIKTDKFSPGVDTPEDVKAVEKMIEERGKNL